MGLQYLHADLTKKLTHIFDEYQSLDWPKMVSLEGPTIGEHYLVVCLYDWLSTGQASRSLMQFLYLLTRDVRQSFQINGYSNVSSASDTTDLRYEVDKVLDHDNHWQSLAIQILDLQYMNEEVARESPGSRVLISLCLECATVVPSLSLSPAAYCSPACKTNASSKQEDGSHKSRWRGLRYWDSEEVITKSGRVVDSQHQLFYFSRTLARALSINAGIDFSKRINRPFKSRSLSDRWDLLLTSHSLSLNVSEGLHSGQIWRAFDVEKSTSSDKRPVEPQVVDVFKENDSDIQLEIKALCRLFETDADGYWGQEGEARRSKLRDLSNGKHPMCNPLILTQTEERKRYLTDPTAKPTVNYKADVLDSDTATIWSRPKSPRSKIITHQVDFSEVRKLSKAAYIASQEKPLPFEYDDDMPVPVLSFSRDFVRNLDQKGIENTITTVKKMHREDILRYISTEVRQFQDVRKDLRDQYSTKRYAQLMHAIERAVFDAMKRTSTDPDYIPFDLKKLNVEPEQLDVPEAVANIFKT